MSMAPGQDREASVYRDWCNGAAHALFDMDMKRSYARMRIGTFLGGCLASRSSIQRSAQLLPGRSTSSTMYSYRLSHAAQVLAVRCCVRRSTMQPLPQLCALSWQQRKRTLLHKSFI